MIKSMTGFGEACEQVEGIDYAVEVRSLNNRYFKAAVRLPEEIVSLEAQLEAILRKRIYRGSVTLTARLKYPELASVHQVDDEALVAYLNHLEMLQERVVANSGRQQAVNIDLTALLNLPGVLRPSFTKDGVADQAAPVVTRLTERACQRLTQMRLAEGEALAQELASHCAIIEENAQQIAERAPRVVDEYHQRLRQRIDTLLARAELNVDEADLIKEVAIFAERSDIREELTRLRGHLQHLEQVIEQADEGEPAGRTLDFLAQELLREANTITSKSNDSEISRCIVDVKGAIDRIKEQVQNVE